MGGKIPREEYFISSSRSATHYKKISLLAGARLSIKESRGEVSELFFVGSMAESLAPLAPVERPDRGIFDAEVAALNQAIAESQKRRDAVQQRFIATRTSNDELNARITEARARFQAIK